MRCLVSRQPFAASHGSHAAEGRLWIENRSGCFRCIEQALIEFAAKDSASGHLAQPAHQRIVIPVGQVGTPDAAVDDRRDIYFKKIQRFCRQTTATYLVARETRTRVPQTG